MNSIQEDRRTTATARARETKSPEMLTLGTLTPREHEVLILLCDGLSIKGIGYRLGISPKTVEYHRTNISRRWADKSTAMLVRKAIRLSIIQA